MKSDNQAYTYGPENSNFSDSSEENSIQNSEPLVEEISLSKATEDFTLMAKEVLEHLRNVTSDIFVPKKVFRYFKRKKVPILINTSSFRGG